MVTVTWSPSRSVRGGLACGHSRPYPTADPATQASLR